MERKMTEYQKTVFMPAVAKAKELRKKNPKLTPAEATAMAHKSPEIMRLKEAYAKKKAAAEAKGKKAPAKSAAKKPAARK